jgi:aminomethyltransferase
LAIVQKVTCNDASRLQPGQSQYSAFLTEKGTFVDDIIVNRLRDDKFLICVNASNADKDFDWVRRHETKGTPVKNASDDYFLIAVQGPEAVSFVGAYDHTPLPPKPFTFLETKLIDIPVLLSRTGYTGEDGFEIYGPWKDAEKIWSAFMEKGAVPCGLGARDTLRLEAALPLYGHEIDDMINPYEAGLGWIVKMDKGDFIGRDALSHVGAQFIAPGQKKLVGLEMQEPGIARQGCRIFSGEMEIGFITSGTKSPFLDRAIALGYVSPTFSSKDSKIEIDIHNKRRHAKVVSLPFYARKK